MSVTTASGAVKTQHNQPTAEQIRLAQLIDDKKHDQPEVQEIIRKVLAVVENSSQEEALVALFDCDYDYEKAVALLIEKGNDLTSEWRVAKNNKGTKKQQQQQQQQKSSSNENGHQRNTDEVTHRAKSRNDRQKFHQQRNGNEFQNSNHQPQTDNHQPQQKQRGGYRGRHRGNNRGGYRTHDKNYQQHEQQSEDVNHENLIPSDMTQRFTDALNVNRRGANRQDESHWDVGNWNGETLVYSRSTNDDELSACINANNNSNVSNTSQIPPGVENGQSSSFVPSTVNNNVESNAHAKSINQFDTEELTCQIKDFIGIGQTKKPAQSNVPTTRPIMDTKQLVSSQQSGEKVEQKSHGIPSRLAGQNFNTKVGSPPPRIPHQPVIFSDRFDGGANKIDVQFGNLTDPFEDATIQNVPVSSAPTFYQHSETEKSVANTENTASKILNSQRPQTVTVPNSTNKQSSFVSPTAHGNINHSLESHQQQTIVNQQRILPTQMPQQTQSQQPPMTMKPVIPTQFAVHPQQHPLNAQSLLLSSIFVHPQTQEAMALDNSYDPTAFQLSSADFSPTYFMAAPVNQQQTQPRYLLQQPNPLAQQQQQTSVNRQQPSTNVQTSTSTSTVQVSATSTAASTAPKKGLSAPPGIFVQTAPQNPSMYSTPYSNSYDVDHIFANSLMQMSNAQQAQSPSGGYGSVTPPVQQQNQQQTRYNNDKKSMSYRGAINEKYLLQQYQQYAAMQPPNTQQQGPHTAAHSPAQMSYFLGHPAGGPSFSTGHQIMYGQPATTMTHPQSEQERANRTAYNN